MDTVAAVYGPQTTNGILKLGQLNGVATTLFIAGTWDGAQVEIYASPDNSEFFPTGAVFTSDICRPMSLNPGIYIGINVSNAGASTSITVKRV